ncbi:recombinase family protein, partial [bacterium]|nr:recombinase family protein [bacterium]
RPAIRAMAAYCVKHAQRIDAVLVWKLDRLSRNQADFHGFKAVLASKGVGLMSATEPLRDDSSGVLMTGILASFAEFDNAVRAERTKSGMTAGAGKGAPQFPAPMGYINTRTATGEATLALDPERAPLIKMMFQLYATTAMTKAAVQREVNRLGMKGPGGKPLAKESVGRILTNRKYAGWYETSLLPEPIRGNWPPIVPDELYRRVQAKLTGRSWQAVSHRKAHPEFPLRRFVRCGKCGQKLTGAFSRSSDGTAHGYYQCTPAGCRKLNIRKAKLEGDFLELVDALTPKPKRLELFKQLLARVWEDRNGSALEAQRRIEADVQRLRARKDKLLDMFLDGKLTEAVYTRKQAQMAEERQNREFEIAMLDTVDLDFGLFLDTYGKMMRAPRLAWERSDIHQRRQLQAILFPEGLSHDGQDFQTFVTCLPYGTSAPAIAQSPKWQPGQDSNLE